MIVCDSNDFVFALTNASPDTLWNVGVTVNTPTGLEYVAGSISNGIELDISIPNAPLFSYPMILPFEGIEFTISSELKCALVTSINSGALFTNTISAEWDGGNNSVTTLPYIIETPLLVVTDVTNTLASATQGETITRTITIQNTRLGTLPSFIFTDNHMGGIAISSALGTIISSTGNSFVLELSGDDFMTIGDGDDLFEKDEVIVITEIVEILDCGFDVPFTNSEYEVSWGCYNQVCQVATQTAVIDIIPSTENPELVFDAYTILPIDYCAGQSAQQGVTIKNIGIYEALEITLIVDLGVAANMPNLGAGFDPNTFVQDSSGVVTSVTPILSSPTVDTDCPFPSTLYKRGDFSWVSLAPGDSISLTWDYYYCTDQEECAGGSPPLSLEFSYLNHCPADTVKGTIGTSMENAVANLEQRLKDSLFYNFGEPLVDAGGYVMNYAIISEKLTGSGLLDVEFTLPCGFSWTGSPLELGGQLPISLDITSSGNETVVTAQYNLPLDTTWALTQFEVNFTCDPSCGPGLGACVIPYITDAGEIGCGTEEEILIQVTLQEDPSVPLGCSMQMCRVIPLIVDCDGDDFPGPGSGALAFLFFNHEFERCNYDLPDNDDNRLADPTGDLDFDKVATDRAIPGDTVTNVFNGRIVIPGGGSIPGLDIELMTVQFEAHTMDNGLNGGQSLNFDKNGSLFGSGGITHVSATVRIFDSSTGTSFECEIGSPDLIVDSIYQEFHVVNTEPVIPIDELLYNQFKYNTSLSNLPCLPAGFEYQDGDSIIFTTKHRMVYNPLPQNDDSYLPPVINMRAAVVPIFCDIFNPFISALPLVHTKWQYSGYRYEMIRGEFHALPCDPFTNPGNIEVAFVLGKDNFFPFEYRPLATLKNWRVSFPTGVTVLDSKLAYLRYQEGANILLAEDLNFSINNGFHDFDIDQWHMPTLDEGWQMRFFHEFEAECSLTSFDSTVFNMEMELNPGLPEPSDINITRTETNFISASPVMNAAVNVANYSSFDNQAIWDLVILNPNNGITQPAFNAWLQPISQTGLMSNFQLTNTTTGVVVAVPQVNGIFQLGTIGLNQLVNYQLTATNNSCETEVIQIHYGWNCTPYTSTGQTPCADQVIIFTATSPNGELEMDVESPVGPFELCDEIDYHTVEIYNAQLGNVFDVVMEATLPLGLELVPNSSQMAYPTDGSFIDIPDPINIAGNVFQWDISALNDSIQNNGLLGVSQDPGNSVSVRFLTTTDCGFVAGSQIIFNVIGKQNCDEPTNSLSKAGDPINIAGVNPQYSSDINIAITSSTSITCDAIVPLNINILPDGATSNADTVLIILPPGVSYVPGSYTPINNAPSTQPIVFNNGGQEILKIKIDAGIPANSLISFEIETTGYGAIGCGDQVIQVQAVQRQDAICTTTGELCYVLAATGSGTITISSEHPDFSLQNLNIVAFGDSVNYEVSISNAGITNTTDIQVDFYIDTDENGALSTGDIFVTSGTYVGSIGTNQTIILNGNMILSADQLCNLIAVIDEDNNCVCGTEAIPVTAPINAVLDNEIVCSGAELEIGIPTTNGHTYQWDPPGNISTTNNSMTIFQFSNTSSDTSYFDFTLIDNNGDGCEVHHTLAIAVVPVPGINQQDLEICAGETVTISATEGGTYVWDGPNISNPNAQAQTVTLFENTTFTVTVTLPDGCEGMDEINIEVLPYESNITSLEKCPEDEIIVMGQQITEAGFYCDTISNAIGCDSLVCVEVINYNSQTEITRELCSGDSIVIEGITYFEEQTVCNTFTSLYGCDSTHCINIQLIPEPLAEIITAEITVAQGEEIQLEVTAGFEMYEWFPTTGLSCIDCHNPIATVSETTEYTVTLTDGDGCTTQLLVLVTVLPPCDAGRLLIPNIFTPDGDGLNDRFGVVEFEGFEMVSAIKIFDRWGEKVYENSGVDPTWDGMIDGKTGPADVYIYVLKIVCSDGETILHGDVTLIR